MEFLKQKLGSRKLWAAVAAAVICVVSAVMGDEITQEYVDLLHYAVTACIAYIFGESAVDVLRQIVEAVRAKYEIPDVSELMRGPENESAGEGEEQSAGESGTGGQT